MPPSLPKTKLGRKITCSRPEDLTACSSSHFAWKYGGDLRGPPRCRGALVEHEPLHSGVLGRLDRSRALHHDALEVIAASTAAATRWITVSAAVDRAPEALGVGQVALDDLAAPGTRLLLLLRLAREHPHGLLRRARACTTCVPTKPVPPATRIIRVKFFQ